MSGFNYPPVEMKGKGHQQNLPVNLTHNLIEPLQTIWANRPIRMQEALCFAWVIVVVFLDTIDDVESVCTF